MILKMKLSIIILLYLTLIGCVKDDNSNANKIYVDTVNKTKGISIFSSNYKEDYEIYIKSIGNLNEIFTKYPSTDIAVKIASGSFKINSYTYDEFKKIEQAFLYLKNLDEKPYEVAYMLVDRIENNHDKNLILLGLANSAIRNGELNVAYNISKKINNIDMRSRSLLNLSLAFEEKGLIENSKHLLFESQALYNNSSEHDKLMLKIQLIDYYISLGDFEKAIDLEPTGTQKALLDYKIAINLIQENKAGDAIALISSSYNVHAPKVLLEAAKYYILNNEYETASTLIQNFSNTEKLDILEHIFEISSDESEIYKIISQIDSIDINSSFFLNYKLMENIKNGFFDKAYVVINTMKGEISEDSVFELAFYLIKNNMITETLNLLNLDINENAKTAIKYFLSLHYLSIGDEDNAIKYIDLAIDYQNHINPNSLEEDWIFLLRTIADENSLSQKLKNHHDIKSIADIEANIYIYNLLSIAQTTKKLNMFDLSKKFLDKAYQTSIQNEADEFSLYILTIISIIYHDIGEDVLSKNILSYAFQIFNDIYENHSQNINLSSLIGIMLDERDEFVDKENFYLANELINLSETGFIDPYIIRELIINKINTENTKGALELTERIDDYNEYIYMIITIIDRIHYLNQVNQEKNKIALAGLLSDHYTLDDILEYLNNNTKNYNLYH